MTQRSAFLFLFIIVSAFGCSRPPAPTPLPEAHQKFLKILHEKYGLDIVLKPLEHTVWVYVPLKEELLRIAATAEGVRKSRDSQERPTIKYIDTSYVDGRFLIAHDIRLDKNYAQSPGYRPDYTAAYQQASHKILTAMSAYFETAQAPQFFVIVITDVRNGIEIENIFYLEDLKWYMSAGSMPQEEFLKRSIYETRGKTEGIGDTAGRHLAYTEITMPEFLAKQITNRVTFAYQKGSSPPSPDTPKELLTIAATTLGYYEFKDLDGVRLRNLADNTEVIADPATLWTYQKR
ncbi:MAG: hypothetical protein HZA28_06000 [Candidatus Omnitrophica bacterium]|nr:hypothetical protein [Candidatus Omnitrophota bacterium]